MTQPQYGICGKGIMAHGKMCTCLLPNNHIGECKNSPFVIDEFGDKVSPAIKQLQLSVRERAREIYNEQDVIKTFIDITDRLGDKKGREYLDSVMLYLIDQIITLAQEEKIKEVVNRLETMQLIGLSFSEAQKDAYSSAIGDVIKILKQ